MSIGTAIANIQRTAHIINTFAKYGLQDFFSSNKLIERIPALQSLLPQKVVSGQKLSRPERLRLVFEELGPTFIKFGQILSNRPDLLPENYIRELEKLQDNVPPFSSKEAIGIIEKSTGRKIDELFSAFDKQPLASASIGQVHKAVLKNGEKVAVKVRRPNIEQIIRNDIEILKFLSEFIENGFEELKRFQITEAIQEFEKVIFKELNFTYEKAAIRRFRKFFSGSKNVIIPAVFSEYSSNRVLVLEYIQGVKLSKIHQDNAINKKNTADLLVDTYFTQIFEYKSFHADPHPGNIFIVNKSKLALIDFGQVGYVLEEDIQNFGKLIVAIYDQDVTSVIRIIKKYSRTAVKNENDLKYEVNEIINDYYYRELNEIDLETVISRFRTLVFKYNITLPSNLFLLLKTVSQVESDCRNIYPQFNIFHLLNKYAKKFTYQKLKTKSGVKELYYTVSDFLRFVQQFPGDMADILSTVKEGKLNVRFEHHRLNGFIDALKTSSNRLTIGLILAAMIVGSGMVILADIPPHWFGISVLGFVGHVSALILSVFFVISIFRQERKKVK